MASDKEIERLKRALLKKEYELENLLQYAKSVIRILDEERIFRAFLSTFLGQTGISRCILRVVTNEGVYVFKRGVKLNEQEREHIVKLDEQAYEVLKRLGLTSLIDLKVVSDETALIMQKVGISHFISLRAENFIALSEEDFKKLTDEDVDYTRALFQITILAYDNILFQKELIEKQKLEKELAIAREIQEKLLPRRVSIENYDIFHYNLPSRYVGGDYYDIYKVDENKYLLCIGDVAGKGIPASLLMASLQSALRAIAYQKADLPSRMLATLNRLIIENTGGMNFITFFLALLKPSAGSLIYTNAGHNPPLLFKKTGEVRRLEKGGLVLGIMEVAYEEGYATFEPGDVLVMYSDGIVEARKGEEEFGTDRLERAIKQRAGASAEEMGKAVLEALKDYKVNDDLSLVVVKRLK